MNFQTILNVVLFYLFTILLSILLEGFLETFRKQKEFQTKKVSVI